MNKVINKGIEYLNQYRGWKTNEKIVVFESDDWGAIRTASEQALQQIKKIGVDIEKCHYLLNDSLETKEDLEGLFNVLIQYKDEKGNHPQFTFNAIMGNPDFQKIREADFSCYFYKPFTQTYIDTFSENIINTWHSAISEGVMYPQFHGREHVNIGRWLHDLRKERLDTLTGFNYGMYGISGHVATKKRGSYLAIFDEIGENKKLIEEIISEGLQIFKDTFNFHPKTFIAPNYIWGRHVEEVAKDYGIIAMQGSSTQILPTIQEKKQGVVKNYLGKQSSNQIGYLIRNVLFEPSSKLDKDWVDSALKQIENSFKNKRPAILDTHRVNYSGTLNSKNRENGLQQLDELLHRMLKKWPDIQFTNSEKLAERIFRH